MCQHLTPYEERTFLPPCLSSVTTTTAALLIAYLVASLIYVYSVTRLRPCAPSAASSSRSSASREDSCIITTFIQYGPVICYSPNNQHTLYR